jgi:hypothetical protein
MGKQITQYLHLLQSFFLKKIEKEYQSQMAGLNNFLGNQFLS